MRQGSAGGNVPEVEPNIPRQPANAQPESEPKIHEGRAFRYVVPQGWHAAESSSMASMAGWISAGRFRNHGACRTPFSFNPVQTNPEEVFKLLAGQADYMKWTDLKVASTTPCNQGTALGTCYELTFNLNGTPIRAMAVIIVFNEANRKA